MKPHPRYLYFCISLVIIWGFYIVFQKKIDISNDPVNTGVSSFFLVLVISYVAIALAIATLLLRLFDKLVKRGSFFYNFTGSVNFSLGLIYFISVFQQKQDTTFLLRFTFHLILGIIIIADIILKEGVNDQPNDIN